MASKKEKKNTPLTSEEPENGILDCVIDFASNVKRKEKKLQDAIDSARYIAEPFINKYKEIEEKQAEIAKVAQEMKIKERQIEEEKAIAKRLDGLKSFHKRFEICDVDYFLMHTPLVKPDQRENVYRDILHGGDWFWMYVKYNARINVDLVLTRNHFNYPVRFKEITFSTMHKEFMIIIPPYNEFNSEKGAGVGGKFMIPPNYLDEEKRKNLYKDIMYSVLFQSVSVVFKCADKIYGLGGENPIETLTATGVKNLFDDSFGNDVPCSVISVTLTKEDYNQLNPYRMNPDSVLKRLNAEINTDLFYTDIYDPKIIKKNMNVKKDTQKQD